MPSRRPIAVEHNQHPGNVLGVNLISPQLRYGMANEPRPEPPTGPHHPKPAPIPAPPKPDTRQPIPHDPKPGQR